METFRISNKKFSNKLSSSGKPNRWNKDNEFVIYTGSSRSLSTLELVVHRKSVKPYANYRLLVISVADEEHLVNQIFIKDLPSNWRSKKAYPSLQKIGSDWYLSKESLILKVPSAVIINEYNYIINTDHPEFKDKVKLVRTEDYFWDRRLLSK